MVPFFVAGRKISIYCPVLWLLERNLYYIFGLLDPFLSLRIVQFSSQKPFNNRLIFKKFNGPFMFLLSTGVWYCWVLEWPQKTSAQKYFWFYLLLPFCSTYLNKAVGSLNVAVPWKGSFPIAVLVKIRMGDYIDSYLTPSWPFLGMMHSFFPLTAILGQPEWYTPLSGSPAQKGAQRINLIWFRYWFSLTEKVLNCRIMTT